MVELTQKKRTVRQSRALIAAFFAAYFLSAGLVHPILGADTLYTLLADLALMLSFSGNAAQLAAYHILLLAVGLMAVSMAFATFASYGNNLLLTLLGAAGLGFSTYLMAGAESAAVLAVLLLVQALLHHWLDYRADCKHMLMLGTLLVLVLMLVAFNASVARHGGALTVEALREGLTAYTLKLGEAYTAAAPVLEQMGVVQQLPNYQPPLRTDQAVLTIINYLPAILGVTAMLAAFFTTVWFRRASCRQLPKVGLVIDEFEVTQVAAGVYIGASLLAFLGESIPGLAAMQYMIVMTLPMSLQGVASIRRNTRETGRGLPILVLILLFFTATPTSILLFFALIGALDRLIPKKFFKPPGSREE